MQKKLKMVLGVLTILICILIGCSQKRDKEELLSLSPEETLTKENTAQEKSEIEPPEETVEENKPQEPVKTEPPGNCIVHICGEVANPGVYTLPEGSRVYQIIEAAGDLTKEAAGDYLNQADFLTDGMRIYVPSQKEIEEQGITIQESTEPTGKGNTTGKDDSEGKSDCTGSIAPVNLNQADEAQLCTLPGIGSSKAKKIIAYRQEHGAYSCIEDVMKVTGIKAGMFEKIKDYITV